jgi:predicted metal-dependent TIM-barrel fold hydrolase
MINTMIKGTRTVEPSKNSILNGFIDTHIHTKPDIKPRLLDDYEAALAAKKHGMKAIVIKSHVESTVSRAYLTQKLTGLPTFGGITLNCTTGGLNPEIVSTTSLMGGKFVWLPTIHHNDIQLEPEPLEEILNIIAENKMVLGTGHLHPCKIFQVLDECHSKGIKKIVINHPLTKVVGASVDQQKEMARHAYLEHCWVATMPQHGHLNPKIIANVIKEVGASNCILATDLGQIHNPPPVQGLETMIETLISHGISWREIQIMCQENSKKLLFD